MYTDPIFDPSQPPRVPPPPVHPETARVSNEDLARETAEISPEGRPASPRMGMRRTLGMAAFIILTTLAIAGAAAYWISPALGLAILIIGVLCVTIFNPVVWAALFRASDNERGAERAERDPRVTPRITPPRSTR